jgi:hypothetical protein
MDPVQEEEKQPTRRHTTPRWVWWSALAIAGLYGLFVLLLWQLGLLNFPSTGNGQAFAAVLALLGGFFGSSLTFIGLLIKHSIDERNAQLAERNQQLAEEAERRLTLDSSIRAVDLLSTADGKPAPPTEQAGALFALAHLEQLPLALTLLNEIWPKGHISTRAATTLIEKGLLAKDEQINRSAADTLARHAHLLPDGAGGIELPAKSTRLGPGRCRCPLVTCS